MFEFVSCRFAAKDKFEIERGTLSKESLFYITKGEIQYVINQKSETAEEGDFVCFPSALYLERKITKSLEFYHVRFENPEKTPFPIGKIHISDKPRLLSTLNYMCSLEHMPRENKNLKNHFLNDIFVQFEVCNAITHMQKDKVVTKAIDYFHKNMDKKITLEETAKNIGISVPGLIGHFKAATGTTPMQYLISIKIKKAESLLCYTNMSIAQIAEECSFDNPYYFSNTFKKYNKISPRTFRKNFNV